MNQCVCFKSALNGNKKRIDIHSFHERILDNGRFNFIRRSVNI